MIHLTYSSFAAANSKDIPEQDTSYLRHLENQREDLKKSILQAPRHRLDNLATFVETHAGRLSHLLESLINYRRTLRVYRMKHTLVALIISLLCGAATAFALMTSESFAGIDPRYLYGAGGAVTIAIFVLWVLTLMKYFSSRFHRTRLRDMDKLTSLENQTRRDSWEAIRDLAQSYLKKTAGRFSLKEVKRDYAATYNIYEKGSQEIRKSLNVLSSNQNTEVPSQNATISSD